MAGCGTGGGRVRRLAQALRLVYTVAGGCESRPAARMLDPPHPILGTGLRPVASPGCSNTPCPHLFISTSANAPRTERAIIAGRPILAGGKVGTCPGGRAMPNPFPGMDPYLEGDLWSSVHLDLSAEFVRRLAPLLRPKYYVLNSRRFALGSEETNGTSGQRLPDIGVRGGKGPPPAA
jgi:Protein of unknown function (DUF4058)